MRVVHTTGFGYTGAVAASYNEARMLPQTSASQFVLEARLDIDPHATVVTYNDYWGTKVSAFEILAAHQRLTLVATSVVEVQDCPCPGEGIDWAEISALSRRRVAIMEQLEQADRTRPVPEVVELAHDLAADQPPAVAAERICREVGDRIHYVRGATSVFTSAADAWRAGAGVCQDIAHISIGALRSVGIPARYVSGYLHPSTAPEIGKPVTGESHAWVEWFAGEWTGFDPTNHGRTDGRHIVVGRGRDYDDVPPLRGVYAGPGNADEFVSVEVTRLS